MQGVNSAREIATLAAKYGGAEGAAEGLKAAAKQLRDAEARYREQVTADVEKRFRTKRGRAKAIAELAPWLAVFGQVADSLDKMAASNSAQAQASQRAVEAALVAYGASLGAKLGQRLGSAAKALLGR